SNTESPRLLASAQKPKSRFACRRNSVVAEDPAFLRRVCAAPPDFITLLYPPERGTRSTSDAGLTIGFAVTSRGQSSVHGLRRSLFRRSCLSFRGGLGFGGFYGLGRLG